MIYEDTVHITLKSGAGYTIYNSSSKVPSNFNEKVLLIGSNVVKDFKDMFVHVLPDQPYLFVPVGWEENSWKDEYFIFSTNSSKLKYSVFRPAYINPSPFGNSLGDHPNGANNPLRENGMRVLFHEEMTLHDRWWAWEARGNKLENNREWSPGKNCVF